MTVALLRMVNPIWEFIISPFVLIGIGYWFRGVLDRVDHRSPDTLELYDWANEEDSP